MAAPLCAAMRRGGRLVLSQAIADSRGMCKPHVTWRRASGDFRTDHAGATQTVSRRVVSFSHVLETDRAPLGSETAREERANLFDASKFGPRAKRGFCGGAAGRGYFLSPSVCRS
jgi:hypothetical protein